VYGDKTLMPVRTRLRALTLATATLLVVAGCSSTNSGRRSEELRVNIGGEPVTFDPGRQMWAYDAAVGRNTFEALLRPTPDLKGVTGLAADSYSVDRTGTVYTFKLHRGARWSDGQPVKAADFVYAWQRILDPRLAASYASFFSGVKNGATVNAMDKTRPGIDSALQTLGLKAVDDDTFQVTLEAPAGYFKWIATLWTGAPVRKDIVAKAGKNANGTDLWGVVAASAVDSVVGNGPFKLSEVVPMDHVTLVPNPYYNGRSTRPSLTKITEYVIDSGAAAYAKYETGELDMVLVPPVDSESVNRDPALSKQLVMDPQLGMSWIDFNVTKAPFDNVKVRHAVSEAIDRNSYVTNVLKGRAISATTLIPKGMRDYAPWLGVLQAFNVAEARDALKASGTTAAQLNALNIEYTYSNGQAGKQLAEFVQEQLKTNLGVNIGLEGVEQKTKFRKLRAGNYTMASAGWGADYPDSQDWFDVFTTGSGDNVNGYSSSAYDAAVNSADAAADESKRDTLYAKAEMILVQDAPIAFLYQPIDWWLVRPYVKGLHPTPVDDFLGDFYTGTIQVDPH